MNAGRAADCALATRDPALPHLEVVLDGDRFGELLARHRPDLGLRSAEATYVRYKPGTACIVAYRLSLAGGEVEAYVRLQHSAGAAKLEKSLGATGVDGLLGDRAIPLPDMPAALYPHPSDRRIRSLPLVLDGARRAAWLESALPEHPELWAAELRPLRWKPERRFVGRLDGDAGTSAVLKVFGGDVRGGIDAATAAGGLARPRTPQVLGRSRGRGILINEWITGPVLRDHPTRDGGGRAGQAVAELHRARAEGRVSVRGRVALHTVADEAQRLRATAEAIARLVPEDGARARAVAAGLASELNDVPPTLTHGDLSADQVVLPPGGAALVDLDEVVLADPLRDLGCFIGAVEADLLAGRLTAAQADELRSGVLAGYGTVDATAVVRWTAIALLHLAPEPFRRRSDGWPERVRAILRRAEVLHARGE